MLNEKIKEPIETENIKDVGSLWYDFSKKEIIDFSHLTRDTNSIHHISQPKGSMSCGAYSIAYYLWETNKAQCVNDRIFIANIYKKIQVGSNNMGISEAYSNPEKMSKELSDNWHSYSYACILSNSSLMPLAEGFNISGININVFDKVKSGANKYAIILCGLENSTQALTLHTHQI